MAYSYHHHFAAHLTLSAVFIRPNLPLLFALISFWVTPYTLILEVISGTSSCSSMRQSQLHIVPKQPNLYEMFTQQIDKAKAFDSAIRNRDCQEGSFDEQAPYLKSNLGPYAWREVYCKAKLATTHVKDKPATTKCVVRKQFVPTHVRPSPSTIFA